MEITADVVLRAWKDESYCQSLPAEVREALPAKPENADQLNDEELALAAGAGWMGAIGGAITGGLAGGAAFGPPGAVAGAIGGGLVGADS